MKVWLFHNYDGIDMTAHMSDRNGGSRWHEKLPLEMFYGILDKIMDMRGDLWTCDFVEDLWVPASLTPHYNRREWIILHDMLQRSLSENN